jgi:hypothetical protein
MVLRIFPQHLFPPFPVSQSTQPSRVWHSFSGIYRASSFWPNNEEQRLAAIGKTACELLDQLEQRPVPFSAYDPEVQREYKEALSAGSAVKKKLKACPFPQLSGKLWDLSHRLVALKYRIEGVNGGVDSAAIDQELYEKLLPLAAQFKRQDPLLSEKELSLRDRERLKEVCLYPKYVQLLLKSSSLRHAFLKAVVRDNVDVGLYVQYPHLFERLKHAYLIPRIYHFARPLLKIEKRQVAPECFQKIVTLPMLTGQGVQPINILDEREEVALQNNLKLSLKKVFQIFSRKNEDPGDLEFFGTIGILNWNSRELGQVKTSSDPDAVRGLKKIAAIFKNIIYTSACKQYERIDLEREAWWNALPVFEELSRAELEKRINDGMQEEHKIFLKEGEWVMCANSNRTTPDLDLDDRHGYLEVYIPQTNGNYYVYPFGKFATDFAVKFIDKLSMIAGTVRAKVAYPDENVFYAHRQHASYPLVLSEEVAKYGMQLVKRDLIYSREGNIVFQFASKNCAHWVQSIMDALQGLQVPNLFAFPLLEAEASNFLLKRIFAFVRQMPERWHGVLLKIVDTFFGSWRGVYVKQGDKLVWESHAYSEMRNQKLIYQPGYLHKQIAENKLKGRIFSGH